jgi:hypothetical protein
MPPWKHSTPRNDITQVYQEHPVVYDGLSFYVPATEPVYRRMVKIKDTFYELWSPNCDKVDFYPGAPLSEVIPSYHYPPDHYIDGRLGPRDWSLHPQHFNPDAPWLGFCQSPPITKNPPVAWQSMAPELVPLPTVWQSLTNGLDPDYLSILRDRANHLRNKVSTYRHPAYSEPETDACLRVLNKRPFYPSESEFQCFVDQSYCDFQDVVGPFTTIQRGMREMEAWLTMISYWKFRRHVPSFSIPMVQSNRVGVWLNGASKLDGDWLLRIGVIPVYIIHTYIEDIDFPVSNKSILDRRQRDFEVNFIRHTCAEWLNSASGNSYLAALPQAGWHTETSIIVRDNLQQVAQFDRDETLCARSASWSFRVARRENKLPKDDVPQMPSMGTTSTGQAGGFAVIAQGDSASSLALIVPSFASFSSISPPTHAQQECDDGKPSNPRAASHS